VSKKREDIRTLYIHFLLGFIMFGDPIVKKGILDTRDTITTIFRGVYDDDFEVCIQFHFLFLWSNNILNCFYTDGGVCVISSSS
jgi:hypothetical protein